MADDPASHSAIPFLCFDLIFFFSFRVFDSLTIFLTLVGGPFAGASCLSIVCCVVGNAGRVGLKAFCSSSRPLRILHTHWRTMSAG